MNRSIFFPLLTLSFISFLLIGCGGGGGNTQTSATNNDGEILSTVATGFSLPSEISAVPTDTIDNSSSPAGILMVTGFSARIQALTPGDLPRDSDYEKRRAKKYVEEKELSQFDIIEQIMNAVNQTNYDDAENINKGPYKAMVAWVEEDNGRETKTLEPWVVDSRMIVENGRDVNRLLAWIEEPDEQDPGIMNVIKAEFKIYNPADIDGEGAYENYGEWELNAIWNDDPNHSFTAVSTVSNNVNTIKIHEKGMGPNSSEMKGILVRSGSSGFGQVQYPDWDACFLPSAGPNCTPPKKTAKYAYNADYLSVDGNLSDAKGPIVKDRDLNNAVEISHHYGLFYADTDVSSGVKAGDSVERINSFGFPVSFIDSSGRNRNAYYGAWQGRHELWGDELAEGTTVSRLDRGRNQQAETYTVSKLYKGIFNKRTKVDASLTDIKDIVVETFLNRHYDLFYFDHDANGSASWNFCEGSIDWAKSFPNNCVGKDGKNTLVPFKPFKQFKNLTVSNKDRKHVNIWYQPVGGQNASLPQEFAFLSQGSGQGESFSTPGLYPLDNNPANFNPDLKQNLLAGGTILTPTVGDFLSVDIGGAIYIQFTGNFVSPATGWVQKRVANFDFSNWKVEFDAAGDINFNPEIGAEFYVHNQGANYIVRRVAAANSASDYKVMSELQTTANPVNISSLLPTGTSYLATRWENNVHFQLITDPTDANFMKLKYLTDDKGTADIDESTVLTLVTESKWGLQAYDVNGAPLQANGAAVSIDVRGLSTSANVSPVEFNWEYPSEFENWGSQQYLVKGDGTLLTLSDPIKLQPLSVANRAGEAKTLSMQFDGWLHGMPDLYHELEKNDFKMGASIRDKIINLSKGTVVKDQDNIRYFIKPLETSVFLREVSDTTGLVIPDFSIADSALLSSVPNYSDNHMGSMPANTQIKYSEGKPVI